MAAGLEGQGGRRADFGTGLETHRSQAVVGSQEQKNGDAAAQHDNRSDVLVQGAHRVVAAAHTHGEVEPAVHKKGGHKTGGSREEDR